jgi:hypothetical protein
MCCNWLWLGGSLACGTADRFSDIDFRIAVAPSDLAYWDAPAFEQIFADAGVLAQQFLRFQDDAFLHHLLLSTAEIVDLHVQSIEREPSPSRTRSWAAAASCLLANWRTARDHRPLWSHTHPRKNDFRLCSLISGSTPTSTAQSCTVALT